MTQKSVSLSERPGDEGAEREGEDDAERGDDDGGQPRFFQLFEVGAQPRGEHDEHDADLGKDAQPFPDVVREEEVMDGVGGDVVEKTYQKPRDQHADDGGKPEFLRAQTHELGQSQDEGERKQDFKRRHKDFRSFLSVGKAGKSPARFHVLFTLFSIGQHYTLSGGERQTFWGEKAQKMCKFLGRWIFPPLCP